MSQSAIKEQTQALQRNWTDLIKPQKLDVQSGHDATRFGHPGSKKIHGGRRRSE